MIKEIVEVNETSKIYIFYFEGIFSESKELFFTERNTRERLLEFRQSPALSIS